MYRLKIGVRTLHWNSREFLINGRPLYLRGFGRHEDSDVRFANTSKYIPKDIYSIQDNKNILSYENRFVERA